MLTNRKFFIITLILIFCFLKCSSKENIVDIKQLQLRNGLYYKINEEKPLNGKIVSFHKNGQKFIEIQIENGKPKGKGIYYFQNGFKDREFFVDGFNTIPESFEFDYKQTGYLNLNGNFISYYEDNGKKKLEGYYKNDLKEGIWTEWYKNGEKANSINYENNLKHGQFKEWDESGKLIYEGEYVCGYRLDEKKDYYFPSLLIKSIIRSDGSVEVIEERTFKLIGNFTWGTYNLPKESPSGNIIKVKDINISEGSNNYKQQEFEKASANKEPNTFSVLFNDQKHSANIKWFYDATNQTRTFKIHYILQNVINVYENFAELDWFFVGSRWTRPIKEIKIILELPSSVVLGDIRLWKIKKMNGKGILEDDRTIYYEDKFIEPNNSIRLRLLFPSNMLSNVTNKINNKIGDLPNKWETSCFE